MSAGGPEVGPRSTEDPLPTVLTRDGLGVVKPFVVDANHGIKKAGENQDRRAQSVDEPLGVVTGSRGKGVAVPFIAGAGGPTGQGKPQSVEDPLGTVVGENHRAFIVPQFSEQGPRSVERPVPTITTTSRGIGVVTASLVQYNGTADAQSVEKPLGTVTAKPRFALLLTFADGAQKLLDIRFRMLKPRELARAQGFPDNYQFTGKTEDVVKQIGNAVPVHLAAALCKAALS
jgi:DNA (cytosine-5)-methyltransferase 1